MTAFDIPTFKFLIGAFIFIYLKSLSGKMSSFKLSKASCFSKLEVKMSLML
jgi:hypothetical protein